MHSGNKPGTRQMDGAGRQRDREIPAGAHRRGIRAGAGRRLGVGAGWSLVACLILLGSTPARAESFSQEFETPENSWQRGPSDTNIRVLDHRRIHGDARSGSGSELLRIQGTNGTYAYFVHEIPPAKVIAELSATLSVRSDRPAIRLFTRAVLPARKDSSGQPMRVLLPGTSYQRPGGWEQLQAGSLPQVLSRRLRALRRQHGSDIDASGAYIDALVINAYGGPGTTTVWIDELRVDGVVSAEPSSDDDVQVRPISASHEGDRDFRSAPPARSALRLDGATMTVNGQAFLPRVIDYNGEPLAEIGRLGFNCVRLDHFPHEQLLAEARSAGIWILSPPPADQQIRAAGIPVDLSQVLAWDLGDGLTARQEPRVRATADLLRQHDPLSRPIVAAPAEALRRYSRLADIVVLGRHPIGTSLSLADYRRLLDRQMKLARPGTPFWIRIQTCHDPAAARQCAALDALLPEQATIPPSPIDAEQLRYLTRAAVAAGARGLMFDSPASLGSANRVAPQRRIMLEMVNLELDLMEPWAMGGHFFTAAESSDPNENGVALQTERARLVIPLRTTSGDQFVYDVAPAASRSFVVPGVPLSNDAYELTPAGVRPVAHRRVTGGIRIDQDPLASTSLLLLTADPLVVSNLSRKAALNRQRAAELNRRLALLTSQQVERVGRALAQSNMPTSDGASLSAARLDLAKAETSLAAGDAAAAYRHAEHALGWFGRHRRIQWQNALIDWRSPVASPHAVRYATLADHFRFARLASRWQPEPNALPGGEFEDLRMVRQAGWRHIAHPADTVRTSVELSAHQPHKGRFSLRLRVVGQEPPPALLENPPLWVVSPQRKVTAGQWLRISGWVRIPNPLKASVDGLMIYDSLAGPALAERIDAARRWQRFELYRAAPEDGTVSVTIALTGLGEAYVDDVRIEIIDTAASPQTPRDAQAVRQLFSFPKR